jgi:hypothetical protein
MLMEQPTMASLCRSLFLAVLLLAIISKTACGQKRSFTVQDSIEMTTFSDPDQGRPNPPVKASPDGKYFAVVTSRGIVASNKVESTIRIYETDQVQKSLGDPNHKNMHDKILVVHSVIPTVSAINAYQPVISGVRWSLDSHSIYFLEQNSSGERQLYRSALSDGLSCALTPVGYDVQNFDIAKDAVVFNAVATADIVRIIETEDHGHPINADAQAVTGLPLHSILKLGMERGWAERNYDLTRTGVIRNGSTMFLRDPDSGSLKPAESATSLTDLLSISPDGRKAIEVLPPKVEPPSWSHYEGASDAFDIVHKHEESNTSTSHAYRSLQYILVDLISGKRSPIVDAPNAFMMGYPDLPKAKWTQDGRKVLVTGTFLPSPGVDASGVENRGAPCHAAIVDIVSRESSCLTYSAYRRDDDDTAPTKISIRDADLSRDGTRVSLTFHRTGSQDFQEKYYQTADREWHRVDQDVNKSVDTTEGGNQLGSSGLSIWIKQALDEPPTLWVTNRSTGQSKEIWDPNPQLSQLALGTASVYHWKDATGHEWTGGLVKPVNYMAGVRYPLVIQTYTFDPHEFLADGMDPTAEAAMAFASSGIAVLQVEKRFDQAITDQEAAIQLPGYEAAIDQLTKEGIVDPKRVGIIGFSRGCYYVASALIKLPKLFTAATVADGLDQSYMQHMMFDVPAQQDDPIYGVKPIGKGLQKWIKEAPDFNLDKVRTPLRIEAIGPMSILQEWELYSSLREQNKPVDLIYIPQGQHILQKPMERMASQQGNVDWFRFWLQSYEDPDPAKADQYKRWEHLRDLQNAEDKSGSRPTAAKPN